MTRAAALILALAALAATPAKAETNIATDTGNGLLNVCNDNDLLLLCGGYIVGMRDGFQMLAPGLYCEPPGVSNGQVKDIVVNYLQAHPESRHKSSYILAFAALYSAWPCPRTAP